MTNRIIKKSHFAKSKILLIVLCLLGLAFSYSCNCRNNSTGPGTGETDTNTKTPQTGAFDIGEDDNNIKRLIVKQNGTDFNSELNIKFTEHNKNNFSASLESVTDESGASASGFTYNKSTGKVSVVKSILDTLTTDGTKKTYKLNFKTEVNEPDKTFTTDKISNFTITVTLQKTQKLDGNVISSLIKSLKKVTISKFNFPTDSAGADKLTTQNDAEVEDADTISPANFQSQFKIKFEQLKSNIYTEVIPEEPTPSGKQYVFNYKFIPAIEYEGEFTYIIEATAESTYATSVGKGSWDTGTTK